MRGKRLERVDFWIGGRSRRRGRQVFRSAGSSSSSSSRSDAGSGDRVEGVQVDLAVMMVSPVHHHPVVAVDVRAFLEILLPDHFAVLSLDDQLQFQVDGVFRGFKLLKDVVEIDFAALLVADDSRSEDLSRRRNRLLPLQRGFRGVFRAAQLTMLLQKLMLLLQQQPLLLLQSVGNGRLFQVQPGQLEIIVRVFIAAASAFAVVADATSFLVLITSNAATSFLLLRIHEFSEQVSL